MTALLIFIGAGLGGLARYGLSGWVQDQAGAAFPWGTLVINVSGSMVLAFTYAFLEGTPAASEWRAFLGIGILGGCRIIKTFSYETMRLMQDGEWGRASFYVAGSVIISLGAAIAGFNLAAHILRRG